MTSGRGRPAAPGNQAFESGGYPEGASYAPEPREARYEGQRRSGGGAALTGTILAGVLMMVSGVVTFLSGLGMITKANFYFYSSAYAYHWTTKSWGWTDLIIGAVIFLAGACVLLGMTWARMVGVLLASLGVIAAFLSLPTYPLWSVVLLALDLFIIWALLRRGRQNA
jgi:hypothetical protein